MSSSKKRPPPGAPYATGKSLGLTGTLGASLRSTRKRGKRGGRRPPPKSKPGGGGKVAWATTTALPNELDLTVDPTLATADELDRRKLQLPFLHHLEYVRLALEGRGEDGPDGGSVFGEGGVIEPDRRRLSGSVPATPTDGDAPVVPPLPPLSTGRHSISLESVSSVSARFDPAAAAAAGAAAGSGGGFDDTTTLLLEQTMASASAPAEAPEPLGPTLLRRRYPRFTDILDKVGSTTTEVIDPQPRQLSWLIQFVDEVFNGRQAFEEVDTGAGRRSFSSMLDTLPPGFGTLLDLDGGGGGFTGKPTTIIPWAMPSYAFSHIANMFGLKSVILQTGWDMLYNLEMYRDQYQVLELFSSFLRELLDTDVLLLFLHARSLIQKALGGSERRDDTVPEPVLLRVLRKLVVDESLVAYCVEMIQEAGLMFEQAPFPVVRLIPLLGFLVDQFQQTPQAIVRHLRYGDDGKGAKMMERLQATNRMEAMRTRLAQRLKDEELKLALMRAQLGKLERDNAQTNGGQRAAVLLQQSEVTMQTREVDELRRKMSEARKFEEDTWGQLMTVPPLSDLASGKMKRHKFGGVSKAAEKDCLRYYLTVEHLLKEHRLRLTTQVKGTAEEWAARVKALKNRAIVRIQRVYRARVAARKAAALANAEMKELREARRLQRAREEAERVEREAAAAAAEAERRRLAWEANKDKAKQFLAILLNKLLTVTFRRWQLFRTVNKRFAAYRRRQTHWWFSQWRASVGHLFRARTVVVDIQRVTRGFLTRRVTRKIFALKRQQSFMASQAASRLLNRLLHSAFLAWHEKTKQLIRVRGLMGLALGRRTLDLFTRWMFITMECKEAREFVATRGGALWRGFSVRLARRRVRAATLVQGLYRSRHARRLANRLRMAQMNMEEKIRFMARRILMRGVTKALNSWKRYVRKMRRVKRLCNKVLGNGLRARLQSWRAWMKAARNARKVVANGMYTLYASRRFRIHVARLVIRTGAAVRIQAFFRASTAKRLVWRLLRSQRAAVNIQRVYRGYVGRTYAAWQLYYKNCAVMIQRVYRGHVARKHARWLQIEYIMDYAKTKHYDGMEWAFAHGWGYTHDRNGDTALHHAANHGSRRIVKLCLRKEMDPNIRNLAGETPMITLCQRRPYPKQIELLEYLAWHGGELEAVDNTGGTALFAAARSGRTDVIEALVNMEADANHADYTGRTALHCAAGGGHLAALQKLLSYDVFYGSVDHSGATPLHDAAASGHMDIVHHLLFVGADPDAQETDGYTALHYAITGRHLSTAAFLLSWGANANVGDNLGRSPLHMCCDIGDAETALLLIEGDAYINHQDLEGDSALHCAVRSGSLETVTTLLTNGANPNMVNLHGDTPMHLAAIRGYYDIAALLIDYEPDMNVKNFEARTPLGEARVNVREDIIDLFTRKYVWIELEQATGNYVVLPSGNLVEYDDDDDDDDGGGGGDGDAQPRKKRVLHRRLSVRKGKGDLSVVDYQIEWQRTHDEIERDKKERLAAILVQKIWRGMAGRRLLREVRYKAKRIVPIQALVRGWLARLKYKEMLFRHHRARDIQRVYRGHVGRLWYRYLKHQDDVTKGAADINRVYRGFRVRRKTRKMVWKKQGPASPVEWRALLDPTKSYKTRTWRGWDEYKLAGTPDVHFYVQTGTGGFQWDQPEPWLAEDRLKCKNADETRRWGFSMQEWNAATFLQAVWRGRNARIYYAKMRKGIAIMRKSESAYLNNPEHVPHRMNYVLFLHAIRHDYDRARPLYISLMGYMNQRGPDNAVVLTAFALYLAATCEEDFPLIETLFERARVADPRRTKFDLAEHGFFRQAVVDNPKDGHALFNWALVLQYLHHNYQESEQFYMRALDASPSDRRIVANFNYLLSEYMDADYDAYEAFRRLQEERGLLAMHETSQKVVEEMRSVASRGLQRLWRGYRMRDLLLTLGAHVRRVRRRVEKCTTEDGVVYYFDPEVGKSTYELPTVFGYIRQLRKMKVVTGLGVVSGGGVGEAFRNDPAELRALGAITAKVAKAFDDDTLIAQADAAANPGAAAAADDLAYWPMADGWEAVEDEEGNTYYYNHESGESSWDYPYAEGGDDWGEDWGGLGGDGGALALEDGDGGEEWAAGVIGDGTSDPADWTTEIDEDGNSYYYNRLTGETSWEAP